MEKKFLYRFETEAEFESMRSSLKKPWVGITKDDSKVHIGGLPQPPNALKFTAVEPNVSVGLSYSEEYSSPLNLEYSIDGEAWSTWNYQSSPLLLNNVGDFVYVRGDNPEGFTRKASGPVYFTLQKHNGSWYENSAKVTCSGNIMSLLGEDVTDIPCNYCFTGLFSECTGLLTTPSLPATTLATHCYYSMFRGCTSLTSAPALPAKTLAYNCYNSMFSGCTSLTSAPALPATTLADSCYSYMFDGCTSLTSAPALPATTLAYYCYNSMFSGCKSLTSAPALPATTLAGGCYQNMFENCTSLTSAPELPATTLDVSCYSYMFYGCTSLTIAPELPATTLVVDCYYDMFRGCTSLNYIKAMFTTTPSYSYTNNWVYNVGLSGTFVKNAAATWDVRGYYAIPSGWTVKTATA